VNGKRTKFLIVFLAVLLLQQFVCAENARDYIGKGNGLYNAGQYSGAIDQYDQAILESPTSFEPKFNKANSYFRLDDLAAAIDLYREVASSSKDMQLVERAKYNLGNCLFTRGSKQKDGDLQKSLEDFQSAITHWRSALEIDPDDADAARNIEVARLTIKDIIDQINKQKQAAEEQQKKRAEQVKKLKELLDKQKGLAQQNQDTADQLENGDIDQTKASQKFQQFSQQQNQLKNETQQTFDQLQQDQSAAEAAQELAKAPPAQQAAAEKLSQSKSKSAKQSQDAASTHIEKAIEALTKQDEQQKQQQNQQQDQQQQDQQQQEEQDSQQDQQKQKDKQQQESPDKTAEQLLEKEQREKKARQALRGGRQRVEKDW
jgi:Ca-activated chloride channel homolog